MIYCVKCGKSANDGTNFCTACGTQLNTASEILKYDVPQPTENALKKTTKRDVLAVIGFVFGIIGITCAMASLVLIIGSVVVPLVTQQSSGGSIDVLIKLLLFIALLCIPGIPLSAVGIASKQRRKLAISGLILSIIGLIISVVVIVLVIFIALFCIFGLFSIFFILAKAYGNSMSESAILHFIFGLLIH